LNDYETKQTRSGFAGSGATVYTHKPTGNKFEVDKSPNGKTFYGSDHSIRFMGNSMKESNDELNEISKTKLGAYITAAARNTRNMYKGKAEEEKRRIKRVNGIAKAASRLTKD
jgi:hypothetical protein